jgi:hypothetical protein
MVVLLASCLARWHRGGPPPRRKSSPHRAVVRRTAASVPVHVHGALQAKILCMRQEYYWTLGPYRWDFGPRAAGVE